MRHEGGAGGVWGAALSGEGRRILSWGSDGAVRLWDVSRLPAGNLLEVACKLLPSQDVSDIDGAYGIRIADAICGPDMPSPAWPEMR